MLLLEIGPRSSRRAPSALNHRAISPAPLKKFFFNDLLLSYVYWCFSSMCVYVMLSEILELELQTGVDGHVGAGN